MPAKHVTPKAARIAVSLMFFVNGVVLSSWIARIPAIQQSLKLSDGLLGVALLGMPVGALLAFSMTGWLISRLGSQMITTVAALMMCIAVPLPALAPNLPLLLLSLALLGASNGAMDVAMNTQGAEVEERYGRSIMSSFHGFWSVGGIVGASYGSIMATLNIQPPLHLLGIAVVFLIVAMVTSRWLLPVVTSSQEKTPVFVKPTRTLLGLGLIVFCAFFSEGEIANWSGIYLRNFLGATAGLAAASYAGFSLAMTIGRLSGDALTRRLGTVRMVRLSGIITACGLALALIIPHPYVAIIGFALAGIGLASIVPLVFSAAARTPGVPSGLALAMIAPMGYSGSLAGPPLIGFLAEGVTLRGALSVIILLSAIIVLLAHTLNRTAALKDATSDKVSLPVG